MADNQWPMGLVRYGATSTEVREQRPKDPAHIAAFVERLRGEPLPGWQRELIDALCLKPGEASRPKRTGAAGQVTAGRIQDFVRGWAINVGTEGHVSSHWYTRLGTESASAQALCGTPAQVYFLHQPSGFPRCRTCMRKMTRMIKRGEL